MTITNAEILDTVRRLRSYMITLDNCHLVLNGLSNMEDEAIRTSISNLMPNIISTSKDISITLKLVENSKAYRDMIRKFNIEEEDQEDNDNG